MSPTASHSEPAGGRTQSAPHGFPQGWPSIAVDIWNAKYRLRDSGGVPVDQSWADTVTRVAKAAARVEPAHARATWRQRFFDIIHDFSFLPGGRILAGAGSGRRVTLFNCFVMGRIDDDLTAIFDQVKAAALTMQQGGGIGHDFSTLRPKGAPVRSIGADASGPVTFMDVWDAMCRTIMSAGARRGAMMATLRCDHPDIETFVDAKRDPARLTNFNLSVLVTDAFMRAVDADAPWDLTFEDRVYRTVSARGLWHRIMRATYDVAEPGVIFIDRINSANNLAYCETIHATNPCGEQPLPPFGACLLGSLNLTAFVEAPFTPSARLDLDRLASVTATAIRFLDDIIDVSAYPLPAQRAEAKAKRRLGLGVTGLADALVMLGQRYDAPAALAAVDRWMATIKCAAYRASADLAAEKGAFPLCDPEALLARPGLRGLPDDVRGTIAAHGLRNGLLTSIAPTGTISLLAGNVSSGIEPVFAHRYERRVLAADGSARTETVEDFAHALYRRSIDTQGPLPAAFVTANALTPAAHLDMQATAQLHIDSAISKTINCPADLPFDAFEDIYRDAYRRGLKGITTYRPNAVRGAVLTDTTVDDVTRRGAGARVDTSPSSLVAAVSTSPSIPRAAAPQDALPPRPMAGVRPRAEGDVVYMTEPLSRDPILSGFTYKLRWPGSDHALYVTINDIEQTGRRRPFEIFINSKNLEHYAWTLALTRMISAVFRRGGDVTFVVEELKAVFDPQGGRWMEGRYVPSLLAAIGEVIETHLARIGFSSTPSATGDAAAPLRAIAPVALTVDLGATVRNGVPRQAGEREKPRETATSASAVSSPRSPSRTDKPGSAAPGSTAPGTAAPGTATAATRSSADHPAGDKLCPRCSQPRYVRRDGCWTCEACGHSTCG